MNATFIGSQSSRAAARAEEAFTVNDLEYNAKLDELDHLLNDDDAEPAEPSRIWDLLAEVSCHDLRLQGCHG